MAMEKILHTVVLLKVKTYLPAPLVPCYFPRSCYYWRATHAAVAVLAVAAVAVPRRTSSRSCYCCCCCCCCCCCRLPLGRPAPTSPPEESPYRPLSLGWSLWIPSSSSSSDPWTLGRRRSCCCCRCCRRCTQERRWKETLIGFFELTIIIKASAHFLHNTMYVILSIISINNTSN